MTISLVSRYRSWLLLGVSLLLPSALCLTSPKALPFFLTSHPRHWRRLFGRLGKIKNNIQDEWRCIAKSSLGVGVLGVLGQSQHDGSVGRWFLEMMDRKWYKYEYLRVRVVLHHHNNSITIQQYRSSNNKSISIINSYQNEVHRRHSRCSRSRRFCLAHRCSL